MSECPRILAIDPGSLCGWAVYRGGDRYEFGRRDLRRFDYEYRLHQFGKFLSNMIRAYDIEFVCNEMPYIAARETGEGNFTIGLDAQYGIGFKTITIDRCLAHNLPVPDFLTSNAWRSLFFGEGRFRAPDSMKGPEHQEARRKWLKQLAIDRCQDMGFNVQNDDEAEAIGLCMAARIKLDPKFAYERGAATLHQQELSL